MSGDVDHSLWFLLPQHFAVCINCNDNCFYIFKVVFPFSLLFSSLVLFFFINIFLLWKFPSMAKLWVLFEILLSPSPLQFSFSIEMVNFSRDGNLGTFMSRFGFPQSILILPSQSRVRWPLPSDHWLVLVNCKGQNSRVNFSHSSHWLMLVNFIYLMLIVSCRTKPIWRTQRKIAMIVAITFDWFPTKSIVVIITCWWLSKTTRIEMSLTKY